MAMLLASCVAAGDVSEKAIDAIDNSTAAPDAIRGVHNVSITVSDIDATLAFYGSAVPFELIDRRLFEASSIPSSILAKRTGQIELALVRTPTVFLRLIDIDPDGVAAANRRPPTGPGYTHVCWQSPADAPKYDRFLDIGLDMLSRGPGPVDLGGYGVTYAYGFDPDGVMLEMEQVDRPLIERAGYMGERRLKHEAWISHVANVTGDKPAMVSFYRTVLGYGPRREIPPTRRKTFDDVVDIDDIEIAASWFDIGNIQLELWHYSNPPTPLRETPRMLDEVGYSSIAFEVTDLAGTRARLEEEGLEFATESFELGDWSIAFARDPEGNLIAFQQRTEQPDLSIESMRWFALTRSPEP
ncbi:MAG: VOC family protein [Erythrobacter sp.]|nr:VOC family protein [Erythrobacter sp.]